MRVSCPVNFPPVHGSDYTIMDWGFVDITIPDDISILSLNLSLIPGGGVTGNFELLEKIASLNKIDIEHVQIMHFIALWYQEHIKAGGVLIENYSELKTYFLDALNYIKYPDEMNFNSLLNDFDTDKGIFNSNISIDESNLEYIINFNYSDDEDYADSSQVDFNDFAVKAYDEYMLMGGKFNSEIHKLIESLRKNIQPTLTVGVPMRPKSNQQNFDDFEDDIPF